MPERLLIVGQGLAGSLLAWECERAGVAFEIADAGHERSASRIGAGMITPVTGRRWTKTWRIEAWQSRAERTYRELESELGRTLYRPMRVWRRFRYDGEREGVAARVSRGELAPYVRAVEPGGCWIENAAHVDTAALIAAARARWLRSGVLTERRVDVAAEKQRRELVVLCGGIETLERFAFVPWERAWGEILDVATTDLDPNVIQNCGHWALPLSATRARVGASYVRAVAREALDVGAGLRAELEASAQRLLPSPSTPMGWSAGWRVTTPDRRPCAGRHPLDQWLGVLGALGSKGTLWAPELARQWVQHLTEGARFDSEADVGRFLRP